MRIFLSLLWLAGAVTLGSPANAALPELDAGGLVKLINHWQQPAANAADAWERDYFSQMVGIASYNLVCAGNAKGPMNVTAAEILHHSAKDQMQTYTARLQLQTAMAPQSRCSETFDFDISRARNPKTKADVWLIQHASSHSRLLWLLQPRQHLDAAGLKSLSEVLNKRLSTSFGVPDYALKVGTEGLELTHALSDRLPANWEKLLTVPGRLMLKTAVPGTGSWKDTGIGNSEIKSARADLRGSKDWIIQAELNRNGTQLLAELTKRIVGQPLGIFLDEQLISAPKVSGEITGGSFFIEGGFTAEKARNLAGMFSMQPLPTSLTIKEKRILKVQ